MLEVSTDKLEEVLQNKNSICSLYTKAVWSDHDSLELILTPKSLSIDIIVTVHSNVMIREGYCCRNEPLYI